MPLFKLLMREYVDALLTMKTIGVGTCARNPIGRKDSKFRAWYLTRDLLIPFSLRSAS